MDKPRLPAASLHRQVLILPDTPDHREALFWWLESLPRSCCSRWVGPHPPQGVNGFSPAHVHHQLGTEVDVLVFELDSSSSPDAMAIAAGWVRGGGVLFFLVGSLENSVFGKRLHGFLQEFPLFSPGAALEKERWPYPIGTPDACTVSRQQHALIEEMRSLPEQAPGNCQLLTAPRGRGKSTVLGKLLAIWSEQQNKEVWVTSTSRASVQTLFRSSAKSVPLSSANAAVNHPAFRSPEQILQTDRRPDILLVDEAAALPAQHWIGIAKRADHCVFSSTTVGFEGSGRGFALRFAETLRQSGLEVREFSLEDPVRWAHGDPLEQWLNRLLLLDTEEPLAGTVLLETGRPEVEWIQGRELAAEEYRLRSVMALLRSAHYRTRPSDLRRWLDDPALEFGLMYSCAKLLGVIVVLVEPGLDERVAEAVFAGERRPSGHFLPCALAAQAVDELTQLECRRILRVAVLPDVQRRGLGSALLKSTLERARIQGSSVLLGASFAARSEMLAFWQACGFSLLQVGFRREPVIGLHSVVMLKALQPAEEQKLLRRQLNIARDWLVWRQGPLRDLEEEVAARVSALLPSSSADTGDGQSDQASMVAFAHGMRSFEWALPALQRWLQSENKPQVTVSREGRELLERSILQQQTWEELARFARVSGRAGVILALRRMVATALAPQAPDSEEGIRSSKADYSSIRYGEPSEHDFAEVDRHPAYQSPTGGADTTEKHP